MIDLLLGHREQFSSSSCILSQETVPAALGHISANEASRFISWDASSVPWDNNCSPLCHALHTNHRYYLVVKLGCLLCFSCRDMMFCSAALTSSSWSYRSLMQSWALKVWTLCGRTLFAVRSKPWCFNCLLFNLFV